MQQIEITEQNFLILAAKFYDNIGFTGVEEFNEDLQRIKYLKKLFSKYVTRGDLKHQLILNHLITLNNVFGPEFATSLLFFRIEPKYYSVLKTFCSFLHTVPPSGRLRYVDIDISKVQIDLRIMKILRRLG